MTTMVSSMLANYSMHRLEVKCMPELALYSGEERAFIRQNDKTTLHQPT